MNRLCFLICCVMLHLAAHAQEFPKVRLLILQPQVATADSVLREQVAMRTKLIRDQINVADREMIIQSDVFQTQPEFIRKVIVSETQFIKNSDLYRQASILSGHYLNVHVGTELPSVLVRMMEAPATSLKQLAEQEDYQFVLNFPKIELRRPLRKGGAPLAVVSIQLYSLLSDRVILDKTYTGDWNNPGNEFECEDKTLNCCINNALARALPEVETALKAEAIAKGLK